MPKISLHITSEIEQSVRVRQLGALFDVPLAERQTLDWDGDLPIENMNWNVGLILGPSGCGKTQLLRHLFSGHDAPMEWTQRAVVDDFEVGTMQDISETCSSVGFNTIPAWMRPYGVLSNGEKFRVEMARRLLRDDPIIVDEFTSVVDRQVAQIGAHAVQKKVRKLGKKFVAASCHYDILDWLQPDWVLEPATMSFVARGSLQRRPSIEIEISRVRYEAWHTFAPFHYLTADLNKAARCFCLFANGQPAAFGGVLYRPHAKVRDIRGLSRLVTLPDFQGLGLAMILAEKLGAAYKAIGCRFHTYPAHPSLIRSFAHQPCWKLQKKGGTYSPVITGPNSSIKGQGGRPCAVFEYCGAPMESISEARSVLSAE